MSLATAADREYASHEGTKTEVNRFAERKFCGSPALEREEELRLAKRFRDHRDQRAGNTLVRSYAREVSRLAARYRRYGIPLAELVAEANFGVALALEKFDPERGLRFATYASYWVRAQILDYVRHHAMVSGSAAPLRSQLFFKLRRERARVTSQLGIGAAADGILAQRLGVSLDELQRLTARLDARNVSLEQGLPERDRRQFEMSRHVEDPEQRLCRAALQRGLTTTVAHAVSRLDARERHIALNRLMAEPEEEQSLADVGRFFNVSRERARQLEARTMRKLRRLIALSGDANVGEWLASRQVQAAPGAEGPVSHR